MFRIGLPLSIKAKIFFPVLFIFFFSAGLFARGKKEEEPREKINTEFILCITAFDVSALPQGQQVLGSVMQKELIWDLNRIHHRIRGESEITRYEELAMNIAMHNAAALLSDKRAERDALLYQGVPQWKLNRERKRIDKEITELEAAYKEAEEYIPLITEKPLFIISELNREGAFPPPPKRGEEESFLKANTIDAFLSGAFRIVYGRVYAEFRIFTRGASFIYEDSTIFSQEDLNPALDELKARFLTALVNSEPGKIRLSSDPEYARIELNGRLAKSGDEVEIPPGPVTIRASAEDHGSEEQELELEGGDTEEIAFILKPFTMELLGIAFPGPESSVYMGAMYLGSNKIPKAEDEETGEDGSEIESEAGEEIAGSEVSEEIAGSEVSEEITASEASEEIAGEVSEEIALEEIPGSVALEEIAEPEEESEAGKNIAGIANDSTEERVPAFFSVYVPIGQYRYIRVETEDGLTGEAIVKGSSDGEPRIITLQPRRLPGRNEKPVEEKRRKFYGAFGRFWVALPLAFLATGFYQNYLNGYTIGVYTHRRQDMYSSARTAYYVTIGAWAVTGVFLVESLVRMGIYVHKASTEAVPLVD